MSMRRPIAPWPSRFCNLPFHKSIWTTAENVAAPTTTGRHHPCITNIPIPPATRPSAASMSAILARFLVAASPRSRENAHDPSGQIIPGLSSKYLALCPKYNKWTMPCRTMNTPNMNLIEESLLSNFSSVVLQFLVAFQSRNRFALRPCPNGMSLSGATARTRSLSVCPQGELHPQPFGEGLRHRMGSRLRRRRKRRPYRRIRRLNADERHLTAEFARQVLREDARRQGVRRGAQPVGLLPRQPAHRARRLVHLRGINEQDEVGTEAAQQPGAILYRRAGVNHKHRRRDRDLRGLHPTPLCFGGASRDPAGLQPSESGLQGLRHRDPGGVVAAQLVPHADDGHPGRAVKPSKARQRLGERVQPRSVRLQRRPPSHSKPSAAFCSTPQAPTPREPFAGDRKSVV